jgi:hypothetical protein
MDSLQKILIQNNIEILDDKNFIVQTKNISLILKSIKDNITNVIIKSIKDIGNHSFLISLQFNYCKGCNIILDNKRQFCQHFYCPRNHIS